MLYVAFVNTKPEHASTDLTEKSRKWWNEGDRPAGLKTVAAFGTVGTRAPSVFVLDAGDVDDLAKMVSYWNEVDFEIHPAVDLVEAFRSQGMQVG